MSDASTGGDVYSDAARNGHVQLAVWRYTADDEMVVMMGAFEQYWHQTSDTVLTIKLADKEVWPEKKRLQLACSRRAIAAYRVIGNWNAKVGLVDYRLLSGLPSLLVSCFGEHTIASSKKQKQTYKC